MTTFHATYEDAPPLTLDTAALRRVARSGLAIVACSGQVFGLAALLYLFAAGPGALCDHASTVPISAAH